MSIAQAVRELLASTPHDDVEVLCSATVNDVVELATTPAGDAVLLEASGVREDGAGSLAWALPSESGSGAVRKKYRMMCAMLKDARRNQCYAQAIQQSVRAQIQRRGDCLVLDIGTGFGFLGLVAAHAGATVVGVEMNEAVAGSARLLVRHAGLDARMVVHSIRSDELEVATSKDVLKAGGESAAGMLPRRADVIVTETLDSEMLSEGIVPTLRHACAKLLDPRYGVVVPGCAEVFVELVSIDASVAPDLALLNTSGVLRWEPLDDGTHAPLADLNAQTDPAHSAPLAVQADYLKRTGAITALSEPILARTVDFNRLHELPERCDDSVRVVASAAGRCDALLVWWQVECAPSDDGEPAYIGTVPGAPFQDHWHSMLYPAGRPLVLKAGDAISLNIRGNDERMEFEIESEHFDRDTAAPHAKRQCAAAPGVRPPRLDTRIVSFATSIERVWELSNPERTRSYAKAIQEALRAGPSRAMVVDVSEGAMCACIAAGLLSGGDAASDSGAVISLEPASASPPVPRRMWAAFAERLRKAYGVNLTVVDAQCDETSAVRDAIMSVAADGGEAASAAGGGAAETTPPCISLVVAEPYYHCCAGRATLSALNLHYQLVALRAHTHPDGTDVVPSRAVVRAIAVRFDELLDAHGPLGADVAGVDHTPLDALWAGSRELPMAYHLWQYAHAVVSTEPIELMSLDYVQSITPHAPTNPAPRRVVMPMVPGTDAVDAIAVSVAYPLRPGANVSESPTASVQHEVFLLPQRRTGDAPLEFEVAVRAGELCVQFATSR